MFLRALLVLFCALVVVHAQPCKDLKTPRAWKVVRTISDVTHCGSSVCFEWLIQGPIIATTGVFRNQFDAMIRKTDGDSSRQIPLSAWVEAPPGTWSNAGKVDFGVDSKIVRTVQISYDVKLPNDRAVLGFCVSGQVQTLGANSTDEEFNTTQMDFPAF